jgi:tRNA 2-thiocytidine biosynthesis protein TtcA
VVIRPLAYVAESDLERWAEQRRYPIIPCNLCGTQVNLQRAQIKKMLREWESRYPGRIDNMAASMGRITPSHLMDRNLHPFTTLQATGVSDREGDKAFDDDDDDGCADARAEQPVRVV